MGKKKKISKIEKKEEINNYRDILFKYEYKYKYIGPIIKLMIKIESQINKKKIMEMISMKLA